MKQADIFMNELIEAKQRQKHANAAAASMMLDLQIPGGRNLSFFLGIPKPMPNQEAIAYWILINLPESQPMSKEVYYELKGKLYRLLMDTCGETIH